MQELIKQLRDIALEKPKKTLQRDDLYLLCKQHNFDVYDVIYSMTEEVARDVYQELNQHIKECEGHCEDGI